MKTWIIEKEEDLSSVANSILNSGVRKIAFQGDLGVGKTTLIKEIVKVLGSETPASSPTFSIVNEYRTRSSDQIFHFDFYRIKSLDEVYDIGYEDYFYSDAYVFVEWPEKIVSLLPESFSSVKITLLDDMRREIQFEDNTLKE